MLHNWHYGLAGTFKKLSCIKRPHAFFLHVSGCLAINSSHQHTTLTTLTTHTLHPVLHLPVLPLDASGNPRHSRPVHELWGHCHEFPRVTYHTKTSSEGTPCCCVIQCSCLIQCVTRVTVVVLCVQWRIQREFHGFYGTPLLKGCLRKILCANVLRTLRSHWSYALQLHSSNNARVSPHS